MTTLLQCLIYPYQCDQPLSLLLLVGCWTGSLEFHLGRLGQRHLPRCAASHGARARELGCLHDLCALLSTSGASVWCVILGSHPPFTPATLLCCTQLGASYGSDARYDRLLDGLRNTLGSKEFRDPAVAQGQARHLVDRMALALQVLQPWLVMYAVGHSPAFSHL